MDRAIANAIINNYVKQHTATQSSADVVNCLQSALLDLLETVEPSHCMRVLSKFEVTNSAVPDYRNATNICT